MKKLLFLALVLFPILNISVSAAPVALDLLGGGLSILDSLVLIAVGMILIGLIFICIAFLKSTPKEKDLEIVLGDNKPTDFFDNETEDDDMELNEDSDDISEEESDEEIIEPEAQVEPESTPDEETIENDLPAEDTIVHPKLILIDPQTNDFKVLPLCGETTIGRKNTNDLVLIDDTISSLHCVIYAEDNQAFIEDKASTNGTYINGERITEKTEIKHGDMLTIGKQSFLINYHA